MTHPDRTDYDPIRPIVLVGYSGAALAGIARVLPERSVVVVDEPDVLRKREAYEASKDAVVLRELVAWEYQREHAADAFYLAHRRLNPIAVVPVIDYTVPFAARLAERYRVPGAGYGAARTMRSKPLQRAVTAAAGIPNPRSVPVDSPDQLRSFLAETGGPVVLKPAYRQGSLATVVVRQASEVAAAWEACQDQDEGIFVPDRPMPQQLLAEECIEGDEFSVELVVQGGHTVFAGPTRKYLLPGARPIEVGHSHPADVDRVLARRLVTDTERVIDAVGMDTGMVHCEWIVRDGVPHLVEVNGRPAGALIVELLEIAWDYDIVREFYAVMRGLPLGQPQAAAPARYAANMFLPISATGVITRVDGLEAAQAVPGVRTVVTAHAGERVAAPSRTSNDMLTMLTATGPTEQAAVDAANRANDLITFTIEPD